METIRNWASLAAPSCHGIRKGLDLILLWFCILLLISMAIIIIVAVFSRSMGSSLAWYDEVASNLLAWLTYYGAGLAVLRGAHLDFSTFVDKLPMPGRLIAFALAKLIVMSFFAVMVYAGWILVDLMQGEALISLEWVPMPLVQSALPVGAMLFILAELVTVPDGLLALFGDAEPDTVA